MHLFLATLVFVGIAVSVNGADLKCGRYLKTALPWMTMLYWRNETKTNFCGGTIVAEKWILTSAHCLRSRDPNDIVAYVGVHRKDDRGTPIFVQNIYDHPKYDPKTAAHDIKLLQLKQPIIYNDRIQPVCLASHDDVLVPPNTALVAGWGPTSANSTQSSTLLESKLPIVDFDTCVAKYKGVVKPPLPLNGTLQVCAGGKHLGLCEGDFGDPLSVETSDGTWFQHGIASLEPVCGGDYPTVFTRVSGYCDWIESTTRGAAVCHKP